MNRKGLLSKAFFIFARMRSRLFLFLCLSFIIEVRAQQFFGVGAALHRYDQVLSVKVVKSFDLGGLGLDLGLGVERSLQGALAPAVGLFWIDAITKCPFDKALPFYSFRYQCDIQKTTFLDLHQGIYGGLGLAFGPKHEWGVALFVGLAMESLSGLHYQNKPIFFNPQLQLHYFLFRE
ncbi:MAG: hypothetical protein RL440_1102 [Bacteroidota bacterium]